MGLVYKRICETGLVYYGSTKLTLKTRISKGWDTCNCKNFINSTIQIIEYVEDDLNLLNREYWYIQNNECVNLLGKYRHLSKEEYKKTYNKQYRIDNKEKIKKYESQKINCDHCNKLITKKNYAQHRRTKNCLESQ